MTVMSRLQAIAVTGGRRGAARPVMSVPAPSGRCELRMRTGMSRLDGRQDRARVQHLGAEVGELGGLGERQLRHDARLGARCADRR